MIESLDGWDERATVAALTDRAQLEQRAGCETLEFAAHFADLHPPEGLLPQRTPMPEAIGERALSYGGDGTPEVAEFAPARLAPEIGKSPYQATALIADALDLRHRLPRCWQHVRHARLWAWRARMLARRTRPLSAEDAGRVDALIADKLTTLADGTVSDAINDAIAEANPERAQRLTAQAERDRVLHVSRRTIGGTKTIFLRVDAADAIRFEATAKHFADILTAHQTNNTWPAGMPERNANSRAEWEAVAGGLLGHTLIAAQTMVQAHQPPLPDSEAPPAEPEPEPEPEPDPERRDSEITARRAAFEAWLRDVDPTKFAPPATLYVHLSDRALFGGTFTGRVEDIGTTVITQIRRWLGPGARVRAQPVLDPTGIAPVNGYRPPPRMADAVRLINTTSIFPHSPTPSRHCELDHAPAYRPPPNGPPGQTRVDKLGPLNVPEHRYRTFANVAICHLTPGTHAWRTPYGRVLIVDHMETIDLGTGAIADAIWQAIKTSEVATAA